MTPASDEAAAGRRAAAAGKAPASEEAAPRGKGAAGGKAAATGKAGPTVEAPAPGKATPTDEAAPGGKAAGTRRRGAELRTAILAAALAELRTTGYAGLSMDSVAATAGTGKAALYRRWPNRDELVADALSTALPDPAALPLTGDPRSDLLALLGCVRDTIALTFDNAFSALRREGSGGQGLIHTLVEQRVMDPCRALTLDLLRRGIASGRFRPGADNERVAGVGTAMLVQAVVTSGPKVADDYLAAIVDDVVLPLVTAHG